LMDFKSHGMKVYMGALARGTGGEKLGGVSERNFSGSRLSNASSNYRGHGKFIE